MPVFFWNQRHLDQANALGIPNVRSIGAPFYYALENLYPAYTPAAVSRSGTLVLPSHSAEETLKAFSVQQMIEFVERNFSAPFTVSVYYQDLATTDLHPFQEADWRVVSFGSRRNPMFLYQAIAEMSRHSAFVADGPQTGLWYAAALGLQVTVINPQEWGANDIHAAESDSRWRQLSQGIGGTQAQKLAGQELGHDFVLEPTQLERALGWNSRIKRSGAWALGKAIDLRHGTAIRQGNITDRNLAYLRKRTAN
jgi:hypothetical protein